MRLMATLLRTTLSYQQHNGLHPSTRLVCGRMYRTNTSTAPIPFVKVTDDEGHDETQAITLTVPQ